MLETILDKVYIFVNSDNLGCGIHMKGEKPKLVSALVLIGALIVIYGSANLFLNNTNGIVGGSIGLLAGLILLVSSIMLYSNDYNKVREWSGYALLAAFLSVAAFYSVYLGFSVAVIGSLLGLTKNDPIETRGIFLFVLIGGIALFMGSIFLISTSHLLLVIETGMVGALLGIFAIMYSTKLYASNMYGIQLATLQKASAAALVIGAISIGVDIVSLSVSISPVLPAGIAIGTMMIIAGSFSGAVLPNLVEHNIRRIAMDKRMR